MANIATNMLIQANVDGRYLGQQILFTTFWKVNITTPGSVSIPVFIDELHDEFDGLTGWIKPLTSCYVDQVLLLKTVYQVVYPIRYVKIEAANTEPAGTNVDYTIAFPPNVGGALTLKTDVAGASQRGTKHISGLANNFVENGLLNVDGKAAYDLLGNRLDDVYNVTVGGLVADMYPIIYHRNNPLISPIITAHQVGDTTRVERRRTLFLGS